MTYKRLTRNQHFRSPGPKRILSLDGGGVRGIATLAYLKKLEDLLRERHGGRADFRLCHYFDLIAGTSTGSIIAGAMAQGTSVDELTEVYLRLGEEVFQRSPWRTGIVRIVRPRYSHEKLNEHLLDLFGKDTRLGGPRLKTGLLVMTKRMDTGSPWPLLNNPSGAYYQAGGNDNWISNKDYPLWKVIRASTAAPTYFDPEKITISQKKGFKTVKGEFVDGGVSPHNNPTLQAFMCATLKGFGIEWKTGANDLLIISLGTGRGDPSKKPTWISAKGAMQSLLSLMDDNDALVETMAQWMSTGDTHREIDSEIGTMLGDSIGGSPRFTYQRYNLLLTRDSVDALKPGVTKETLDLLVEMDEPKTMGLLHELAGIDADRTIKADHLPKRFDLS